MVQRRRTFGIAAAATVMILAVHGALAEEKLRREVANREKSKAEPIRQIVISIPDRKLALLVDGVVVKTWRTAVGTESTPTPGGNYTIINRVSNPSYYLPGKVIAPGPSNPVGTRWIGLSLKGFGIHGTNNPGSIGRKASHGCVRLKNPDVEELFDLVRIGDVVELHRERDERLSEIFRKGSQSSPAAAGKSAVVAVVASAR